MEARAAFRGFIVTCALVLVPLAARAQPTSAEEEGRRYFEQGRTAYSAGRFDDAARLFRRAYLLSRRPGLLYNVGQAELRQGHDSLALEAFEGYLRQGADPQDRAEVEERVRVLRSMGVTPATQSEVEAASREAQSGGGGTVNVTPWIFVGIGGAAAVAGAILLGVAASEAGRLANAPEGSSWADYEGIPDSAQAMWIAGWVSLGVGAAMLATGIVLAVAGGGGTERAELRIAPNGIALAGTFR